MNPAYSQAAEEIKQRILKLIPDNPKILEIEDPWDLFDIAGLKVDDIGPSFAQVSWALTAAKQEWLSNFAKAEQRKRKYQARIKEGLANLPNTARADLINAIHAKLIGKKVLVKKLGESPIGFYGIVAPIPEYGIALWYPYMNKKEWKDGQTRIATNFFEQAEEAYRTGQSLDYVPPEGYRIVGRIHDAIVLEPVPDNDPNGRCELCGGFKHYGEHGEGVCDV
jgi:hypothetical protein